MRIAAQSGGPGAPLLDISFGEAATGDLSVPGPALITGYTGFSYTSDICPAPGSYTVVSGINQKCFNNSWISLLTDNTPLPDSNGYMMLINDIAHSSPKILFLDTLKGAFCSGTDYQFSTAIINVSSPASGCVRFSSLTLQVEDKFGGVIGFVSTGDIEFAVYAMGYHFNKYMVDFTLPVGTNEIVVKIIDEAKSIVTNCSNGIAIDDIQLKVKGPGIRIGFDSAFTGDRIKSACYQDNKSFTMYGDIDTGFADPSVQWQRSTDDGITWTDIPGATHYTYSQDFPVPDTFFFRLRGSPASLINNSSCSVSSNLLEVQVNGKPADFDVTNNSPVCSGQDLIFNASGGASYAWTGPNGFYADVPDAHIYPAIPADSGTYYVQIKTYGGCVATASTHVTILGTEGVATGPPQSICKGDTVQLSATGGTKYVWTPATGLSDPGIANPNASPQVTTTYKVTLMNDFGCPDTASVKITLLNSIAVKAIISSPDFICRPSDSATFKDMSLGNIATWNWNFGNGVKSILQNPPVQNYFIESNVADYTVHLIVADSAGCADTTSRVLKVEDNCYIAVPNAFTPNGDGLNDYLYPLNAYRARDITFRVFDRYGQVVFETTDRTKKWDGTRDGHPMPADVYVWMLSYTDQSNKKVFLKGSALLIR